ncbi:four helix bundle protein [Candidatus Sumerlaeota bacterium]|nr:four helix bundle protein [Candidatus Sumerlaeota bacterium]
MSVDILDRTFDFAVRIIKLCRELNKEPYIAKTLGRQLIRSGTAIGANLQEAQGGQSRADFISKCAIARKEARETQYWLRLIGAVGIFEESRLKSIVKECDEITAILTTIIKRTEGKSKREK